MKGKTKRNYRSDGSQSMSCGSLTFSVAYRLVLWEEKRINFQEEHAELPVTADMKFLRSNTGCTLYRNKTDQEIRNQ
jgi:hypothetical protein